MGATAGKEADFGTSTNAWAVALDESTHASHPPAYTAGPIQSNNKYNCHNARAPRRAARQNDYIKQHTHTHTHISRSQSRLRRHVVMWQMAYNLEDNHSTRDRPLCTVQLLLLRAIAIKLVTTETSLQHNRSSATTPISTSVCNRQR